MQKEQLIILLQGYFNASLAEAEKETLAAFIRQPGNKEIVIDALAETGMALPAAEYDSHRFDPLLQNILSADRQAPVRKIFPWKKIAVAASIVGMLFVAGYLIVNRQSSIVDPTHDSPLTTHDVKAPDKNRAQITLADGTVVYLDSVANGQLALQNDVKLVKTADGVIAYEGASTSVSVLYNMLVNPRGSKVINLTLNDGTKVWLNSESSLKYPAAFIGNTREVEITGEAYFEVAKDATKKFVVKSNGVSTEVLGTHFNVNAYDDENDIKVTLLEGSVKVSNDKDSKIIKPGQQLSVTLSGAEGSHSPLTIHHSPDLEQVMAWKNGRFQFNRTNITTIMRQIERWYNVEVEYRGNVQNNDFTGGIQRTENVSEVLKMLEKTDALHFDIEGRKILVRK